MNWMTLEHLWQAAGSQDRLMVRFNDWNFKIKYFVIMGESSDGKRFVGVLDTGEKMSYSKKSKGWHLYEPNDEINQAHAV